IESGHCPMHAAKKAMPGSQERHQSKTAQQPADAHHQRHQTRSSSTIESHLCACSVKRDEDLFEALAPRSPDQRPDVQNLPGASTRARWWFKSSAAKKTAPYSPRSHPPLFHARQLQLRIKTPPPNQESEFPRKFNGLAPTRASPSLSTRRFEYAGESNI